MKCDITNINSKLDVTTGQIADLIAQFTAQKDKMDKTVGLSISPSLPPPKNIPIGNPFNPGNNYHSTSHDIKAFFTPQEIPIDLSKDSTEFILTEEEIRTLNILGETDKCKLIRTAKHFLNAICFAESMANFQLKGRDKYEFPSLKLYVREMNRNSSLEYLRAIASKAQIYAKSVAWGWDKIKYESQNSLCRFVGGAPPERQPYRPSPAYGGGRKQWPTSRTK
ncbi:unnamed protein product [Gordionus sp. m RMFG-2023]